MSRRTSVDNWANKLFSRITHTRDELFQLWTEMALTEEQQTSRLSQSEAAVLELLETMVTSERQQLHNIRQKVDTYQSQCAELREELGLDPLSDVEVPSGLVPRGNYLKMHLRTLIEDKEKRMVDQIKVYNDYKEACERIGVLYSDDLFTTKIMPPSSTAELKIKLIDAEKTFHQRLDKIQEIQKKVRLIMSHIGRSCFTEDDLALISMDYDHKTACIDESIVANFEELSSKADFDYEEWYNEVTQIYQGLIAELDFYWKKLHVPESERKFPLHFDPTFQTQNDVEKIKSEIARVTLKYEEHKEIYDKLNEWLELWEEMLSFENPNVGAEKYKNRGGALQAQLKRENKVRSMVPKLLSELEMLCAEHVRKNENIPVIGDERLSACAYARSLMQQHEEDKKMAKLNKDAEKKGRLQHESRFGVSPSPKSALNRVRVTPGSIQKRSKRNLNASVLSISTIEPTRDIDSPKTSSPKENARTPMLRFTPSRLGSPMLNRKTFLRSNVAVVTPTRQTTQSPTKPWRY